MYKKYLKLSLHAMEAYEGGNGGIVPLILNLGTRWDSGQLHAAAALSPGKKPPVFIE